MSLGRRVRSIERHLGRPADVSWQEAYAAWDRIEARLLATCRALADGRPRPVHDPVLISIDEDVMERWRRQRGIPKEDDEVAKARLLEMLKRLAANAASEPPAPRWREA